MVCIGKLRVGGSIMNAFVIGITLCILLNFGKGEQDDAKRESESSPEEASAASSDEILMDELKEDVEAAANKKEKQIPTSFEEYKKMFVQNRHTQVSAVQSLVKLGIGASQAQVVEIMIKQLFQTLGRAKANLTNAGIAPGDPFPEDQNLREAYTKVLENTCLFGDVLLHMPDVIHKMYDKQTEWKALMEWCYGFCLESGVFEGAHEKLLSLMAQEAKIIPKEDWFINPFKEAEKLKYTEPKKPEKKPKKKIARGPRLSSHTEL